MWACSSPQRVVPRPSLDDSSTLTGDGWLPSPGFPMLNPQLKRDASLNLYGRPIRKVWYETQFSFFSYSFLYSWPFFCLPRLKKKGDIGCVNMNYVLISNTILSGGHINATSPPNSCLQIPYPPFPFFVNEQTRWVKCQVGQVSSGWVKCQHNLDKLPSQVISYWIITILNAYNCQT